MYIWVRVMCRLMAMGTINPRPQEKGAKSQPPRNSDQAPTPEGSKSRDQRRERTRRATCRQSGKLRGLQGASG